MGITERREKEKKQRIEMIQEAAKKIFFKKGYAGTTIEAVAQKAELSKATIYLYFKNKDELYFSLMMPALEVLGRQVRDLEKRLLNMPDYNCQDVIMGFFGTMNNSYASHANGIRIMQTFQSNSYFTFMNKELSKKVQDKARGNLEVYRRILRRAIDKKVVKKEVDVYKLSDIVWGLFMGIAQLEEAKLVMTEKNHLESTLKYSFQLIAEAVDNKQKGSELK